MLLRQINFVKSFKVQDFKVTAISKIRFTQAHKQYIYLSTCVLVCCLLLYFLSAQAQTIRHHKHAAERHRSSGKHGIHISQSGGGDEDRIVEKRPEQILLDGRNGLAREIDRARDAAQVAAHYGYWRWGGRGLCLGAGKTRSQKMLENAASPTRRRSGKGMALLPLPPLRTVRATFIAYRSSISKALLDGETRQHIPALTSRYRPGATQRFRLWAHQQVITCCHLLSHMKVVYPVSS